ncbi:CZB domain-containing protein [Acidithiobacillus sp. MC6.1]|nr:CZB domain-containing protein [Acidithiobacillus sp. MC6.1]
MGAEQQCHLGLWLQGEGKLLYADKADLYQQLLERHKRLHILAQEAKVLYDAGDEEDAWEIGILMEQDNRVLMALLQQA